MLRALATAVRFTQDHPYLTLGAAVGAAYGARKANLGPALNEALTVTAGVALLNAGLHAAVELASGGPGALLRGPARPAPRDEKLPPPAARTNPSARRRAVTPSDPPDVA